MDLIDRQATLDALDNIHQEHLYKQIGDKDTYTPYNEGWADACDRIDSVLRELPSADVVEIVRCKDCKWCVDADGLMCKNEKSWVVATEPSFGCVYGERKDGDQNE